MLPRNLRSKNLSARPIYNPDSVPLSYTLLFIALLHFSVWSIGSINTSEPFARVFYTREIENCKTFDLYTQYNNPLNSSSNSIIALVSLAQSYKQQQQDFLLFLQKHLKYQLEQLKVQQDLYISDLLSDNHNLVTLLSGWAVKGLPVSLHQSYNTANTLLTLTEKSTHTDKYIVA